MPRGDKSAYTGKQKRMAGHIEESYEARGLPPEEAERRAWATVNKETGGGRLSGSGRGKPMNKEPSREGGRRGGAASAARPAAGKAEAGRKVASSRTSEERSASARKAAATRRRNAEPKKG